MGDKITHGLSHSAFYRKYNGLTMRCSNPKNPSWKYYGGRGIKCLWENFQKFKEDMYEDYVLHVQKYGEKNTTLDRINNDGNYSKENCRWTTWTEQNKNRSNKTLLTLKNRTFNLVDWAQKLGINKDTLSTRIARGWSMERILNTPARKYTEFRL